MLENYYLKPKTIDRVRACWLDEAIERYVTWLSERDYTASSIRRRIPMLIHFADFAAAHGAKTQEELADHVDGFVNAWVRDHGQRCKDKEARRHVAHAARNPVDQMLRLVLPGYLGHRRVPATPPLATSAPGFFDYLREERGLRPASIDLYTHNLRRSAVQGSQRRHRLSPRLSIVQYPSSYLLGTGTAVAGSGRSAQPRW